MDRFGKTLALLLVFLFLLSVVMLPNSTVKSQSKTIVVPNDYPTISSAIGNATNGDTIVVKEGIYEEQKLTINKSIQIIAEENKVIKINLHPACIQTGYSTSLGTPEYGYENCIEISADNVKLSGFSINSFGGLFIVTSTDNQIAHNKITTGLVLDNANQLIAQNLIKGGLTCGEGSDNSVVEGNFLDGIWCGLVNGVIIRNNIIDSGGIGFAESGNQAFNNTIRNSPQGIYFWYNGYNNKIFHNNFINNTQQVGLYPDPNAKYANIWEDGSISGGNYWDDYKGSDSNKDGIGDTPYVIDDNNKDNYPLMFPVTIPISTSLLNGWSQTETTNTNLPTPSPTSPEFLATAVSSLFVVIPLITILIKKRTPKTL